MTSPLDSSTARGRGAPVVETGAVMAGHGAGLALGLVTAIAFTRYSSTATYADFGYAVSVLGVAALTTLPGFGVAVTRAAARGLDGALAEATRLRLLGSIAGSILLLAWALALQRAGRGSTAVVVAGCALLLPLLFPCNTVLAHLLGKQRYFAYATADVAVETGKTVAVVVAVAWLHAGPLVALAPFAAAAAGYLALTLALAPRGGGTVDPELGAVGRTFTLATGLQAVASQLDRLIIGTFFSPGIMAAYVLAFSLTDPLRGLGGVAGKMLMPRLVTTDTRTPVFRRRFVRLLLAVALGLLAMIVAFWIVLPVVQPLLFPGYEAAIPYARWLVVAAALSILTAVTTQALWGVGSLRPISLVQVAFPVQQAALLTVGAALWNVRGIVAAQIVHPLLAGVIVLVAWLREQSATA